MALYHFSVKQVSRGKGQTVVNSAAYISGQKLYNDYYGQTHDYTKKSGVVFTEILTPEYVPERLTDRETLWNEVEKVEKSKRAQLAYSFDIALQNELTLDENIELARAFCREQFVAHGMIVDLAVHEGKSKNEDEPDNPHFHVLAPIRPFTEKGSWGNKQKRDYVLDEDGKPIEVKPYDRNPATEIIEDFMLMANETVAEEFFWREIPFLYRTHEAPDEDRIRQLSAFVNSFGYHIHVGNEIRPKEIQKLLEKVEGKPEEDLISRLTLRSMKQARYTTENTGHFGLAAKYYTHFTSPIRRYPDLQIHRIIKENLRGRFDENRAEHYSELLQQVAAQCSERERRAEEAEREVVKLKKAEYMRDHIGEEFDGVISGVTKWGAYVELENTVEGLAHVADMWDDHYEFYEQSYELVGEHTGKTYKPGQKVRICVTDADKLQRTVNFRIL